MSVMFRCGHVAIVGRPNVGKSTLLNHLVGQKVSITSRKAQTTRHRIAGILTEPDCQFVFLDTPGFQLAHGNALNRLLNRTVGQVAGEADAVLLLVEAGHFSAEDQRALDQVRGARQLVLAVTKCDRLRDRGALLDFLKSMEQHHGFAAIVPISVKQPASLQELKRVLRGMLPESPALHDAEALTDRSERFLAAEFIREKVFRQVGDELPYATSVVIEEFKLDGRLRRIQATLVVEKPSQRAILIGDKGERLKRIGTEARQDMEKAFGGKVFLELWVRVKKGWADDEALIRQYGYE
ncbi:MAG TPA: GTPase Era [Usitatibacteraceae bacterium]|nr:GTPase Era [Usitatibacteraceae bacterium]